MPRISELTKLQNSGKNLLKEVKAKLNPKTYTSYLNKINDKGKVSIRNIIADLEYLKKQQYINTGVNLTDLKEINKIRNVEFKESGVMDQFGNYLKKRFEYDNISNYEQLYYTVKYAIKNFMPRAQYAIFHIIPIPDDGEQGEYRNVVRSFSIQISYLQNYNLFMRAFNDIIGKGEGASIFGSDAMGVGQEVLLNRFDLSQYVGDGEGSSDKMLFKVEGLEQTIVKRKEKYIKQGDCGKICLSKIITDEKMLKELDIKLISEFNNIEGIKQNIEKWGLKVDIISNSFLLKKPLNAIFKSGQKKDFLIGDKDKKKERLYTTTNLNIKSDIEVVYFNKVENPIATIIYDEFNKHFDIIKDNKIELADDVYISLTGDIIKNSKIVFTPYQFAINSGNKKKENIKSKFVFFDYETVIDFTKNSCMREYSLSILVLDNEQLEKLNDADKCNDINEVSKIRKECCITFLGFDCSTNFIKWIKENEKETIFTFVGFNNANFDNFIFLDALLRFNDGKTNVFVNEIFYNGSQLLNFKVSSRHSTFDIHKHLMGSLSANCKSFKINCCSKKSFDHHKAQQLHEDGLLIDFITDNDELKEYNEFDVLATAVLFCKYRKALNDIDATKPYASDLHNVKTIGSLIYKVFESSKVKKEYDLPKMDFKQYSDLQKCKIAGRVELFNGIQKVEERLVSTDVCSLYPYVMSVAPVYYPCGELVNTQEYMGDDVLGFYYCDIDQSNLKAMNLPKIYARKTEIENDWGYDGVLENYLVSNVIIGLLKKFNCGVVIKNGFYFTEKKKSCDMFDFLLDFMKEKNEQDTLNKNKDELYNPALRETLKLLMNSLSGKVIEGLHTEKTVDVNTIAEYEKIKQKCKSINFINAIGKKIFMTYEVDAESICKKSQRPIYLGVYIYDYAKRYMYENSYSKVGLDELLYTDTDASKFRYSKFLQWKQWIDNENIQVPHWKEVELVDERYKNHKIYDEHSKVFGSFEDELSGMVGDKYVFYCVQKKSWCYSVDGKAKFRFKGLNGSALLLSLREDFIVEKTIKHFDGEIERCLKIESNREKDVYNFANNNKHLSIENGNEEKFFEKIYKDKEAYVLCMSFRKIVKNSLRNVDLGQNDRYNHYMNHIQVNYMMKHICIN